jgi:hypothetical protein
VEKGEGQGTTSQQEEARTPVHLAFEEFEAMNLAFHLTIAPRQFNGCVNCVLVPLNADCKTATFRNIGLTCGLQPVFERSAATVVEQVTESPSQLLGPRMARKSDFRPPLRVSGGCATAAVASQTPLPFRLSSSETQR